MTDDLRPSRLVRPDVFRGGGGGGGWPDIDEALEVRWGLCIELLEPLREGRGEGDGSLGMPAVEGDGLLTAAVRRAGGGGGAFEVVGGVDMGLGDGSSSSTASSG